MAESTKQLPGVGVVLSTVWNGYGEHSKELWKIVLPYVALLSLQGILSALLASTGYTWLVGGIGVVSITLFFVSIWVGILLMRAMYQITMTGKLDVKKVHKNLGAVVWPFIAVSIIVGMITVAGFIAFIHGDHDGHVGGFGVINGFDGLRHDAVVGGDDQDDDVGDAGTA